MKQFHRRRYSGKIFMPAALCIVTASAFFMSGQASAQEPAHVIVPVPAAVSVTEEAAVPVSEPVHVEESEQAQAVVTAQVPSEQAAVYTAVPSEQASSPVSDMNIEYVVPDGAGETELVKTDKFEISVAVGYAAVFDRDSLYDDNGMQVKDGERSYQDYHGGYFSLDVSFKFTDFFALNAEQRIGGIDQNSSYHDVLFLNTLLNLQFMYEKDRFAMAFKLGVGIDYIYFAMNAGFRFSYLIDEHWAVGLNIHYTPVLIMDNDTQVEFEYAGFSHIFTAAFNFSYRF